MLGVKRDAAERIAATHGRDVSHEDAQNVINMFLRKLAECPACEDSGLVSYHRGARIAGEGADGGPGFVTVDADAAPQTCPLCGGGHGDSEWVWWHCRRLPHESCAPDAPASESRGHEHCGWHLVIPLQARD